MTTRPFTVFTPAYNRAHTLRRVYDSLCRQPPALLEWLVVDDGSTDSTPALLQELSPMAPFRMRTVRRANGGKHRAHNTALAHLSGELTVILDSDDELVPGALERLWTGWNAIPPDSRAGYAAVIGHSIDPGGRVDGARYPAPFVDGHYFGLQARGILRGEKLPCYRSDVLQQYPFPECPGNNEYVPEGTIWVQIGQDYLVRCVDEVVRVYHRDLGDRSSVMSRFARPKRRERGAWGRMQYAVTVLNVSGQYLPRYAATFVRSAAAFVRDAMHAGYSPGRQVAQLRSLSARALWAIAFPIGLTVWTFDRVRLGRPPRAAQTHP